MPAAGLAWGYISLKLWQSVHWSIVGLASWVPTWMDSRPQYCSFLQWCAQVFTVQWMERFGVQAQPLLVQLLMCLFLLVFLGLALAGLSLCMCLEIILVVLFSSSVKPSNC